MSPRLTFDEIMPHTRAIVSFNVPDPRSGKVSDFSKNKFRAYDSVCVASTDLHLKSLS